MLSATGLIISSASLRRSANPVSVEEEEGGRDGWMERRNGNTDETEMRDGWRKRSTPDFRWKKKEEGKTQMKVEEQQQQQRLFMTPFPISEAGSCPGSHGDASCPPD